MVLNRGALKKKLKAPEARDEDPEVAEEIQEYLSNADKLGQGLSYMNFKEKDFKHIEENQKILNRNIRQQS